MFTLQNLTLLLFCVLPGFIGAMIIVLNLPPDFIAKRKIGVFKETGASLVIGFLSYFIVLFFSKILSLPIPDISSPETKVFSTNSLLFISCCWLLAIAIGWIGAILSRQVLYKRYETIWGRLFKTAMPVPTFVKVTLVNGNVYTGYLDHFEDDQPKDIILSDVYKIVDEEAIRLEDTDRLYIKGDEIRFIEVRYEEAS
jgi:small nuclear ribonucleoprotein (snRNP)-like protein